MTTIDIIRRWIEENSYDYELQLSKDSKDWANFTIYSDRVSCMWIMLAPLGLEGVGRDPLEVLILPVGRNCDHHQHLYLNISDPNFFGELKRITEGLVHWQVRLS